MTKPAPLITIPQAVLDLSANENPLGPSPRVAEAIQREIHTLHRYPSRSGSRLRSLLAERLHLDSDQITLGNGACELMDLTARALLQPGDEAVVSVPSFLPYQKVVNRAHGTLVPVTMNEGEQDLAALIAAVTENTRLMLLGNPNNPTGTYINRHALDELLAALPGHVLLVIDEAYVEYVSADDYPDCPNLIRSGANLLVLRSLSKAYGLAGLRIGYALGPADTIARIGNERQYYNTSTLAQTAAIAALNDSQHLTRTCTVNQQGLKDLHAAMAELGLQTLPSQANFLLVRVGAGEKIHAALADRGVLVKSMRQFGLDEYIRVSVGRPDDNERFVQTLRAVLQAAR